MTLKIFAGHAGIHLTKKVCKHLGIQPGKVTYNCHSDGEWEPEILEKVRGDDIFIINPTPTAKDQWDTIVLIDSLKRSSGRRLIAIPSYLGSACSDKKIIGHRTSISAVPAVRTMEARGAKHFLFIEPHIDQIVAFLKKEETTADILYGAKAAIPVIQDHFNFNNIVIASPDAGGAKRAEKYNELFGLTSPIVICHKVRPKAGEIDEEKTMVIGDVKGKIVFFIDDIIRSGKTMANGIKAAYKAGAIGAHCYGTHGLFVGDALETFRKIVQEYPKTKILCTNSIDQINRGKTLGRSFIEVDISGLIAEAINIIHRDESFAKLVLK